MRLAPGRIVSPESLVTRVSRALGGARWSRRSFLVRTSLFGSALAMDPKGFALEQRSAYDSVCGTDAACADGFSVFCCTINHGGNFCPDGTFVGGWWKADRSAFCRGAARYYVDCNGKAGWPWRCHCPDTSTCDHRHVACVLFRYGNCSLDVPGSTHLSPVVCRVVTCTPPWIWDPACSETSFTDDLTVSQSAPCLPGPWPSPIVMKWSDLGGPGGPLGRRTSPIEHLAHGAGTWAMFESGAIFDVANRGVLVVDPPVWEATRDRLGSSKGYPLTERVAIHEGDGWFQVFRLRGTDGREEVVPAFGIPQLGTFLVEPPILGKWQELGEQRGVLGYPTRDTSSTPDGTSTFGHFAKLVHGRISYRGAIFANPVLGVHDLWGPTYEKWVSQGAEAGALGYPSTDQAPTGYPGASVTKFAVVTSGKVQSMGAIYDTVQFGVHSILGPVYGKWVATGAERSQLGYPTSDELTTAGGAHFATFRPLPGPNAAGGGGIVSTPSYGTWALLGTIFTVWRADEAGPQLLGAPVADEVRQHVGGVALRSQGFATGTVYDSTVGADCVLYGPILAQYLTDGGPTGSLGLPTSSVFTLANGDLEATFQFGTLTSPPG